MNLDPHADGEVLHFGEPLVEASLAVILLHGRGGSAEDILGLAHAFDLPGVAYLAPQAAGQVWYPQSFLAPREQNEPWLTSALGKVASLVNSLKQAGKPMERIVIGGFSQGACLSTEFVKSNPAPYAGLIAFTGGLIGAPGSIVIPHESQTAELAGVRTLLASGDPDPYIPWARVAESAAVLSAMGAQVTTKRYPGRPHTVSPEEIDLARELLQSAIAAQEV